VTIVRGVRILAARCCGARYASPRYVSMNFSAFEYWTDGWREQSPMPNDEGLRRCKCGRFVLMRELVEIGTAEASDLPGIEDVPDEMLPRCMAEADHEDVEVAARLTYWRFLNHPYRQRYRKHRGAEEAATQAAWKAANPDRRTWWDRLLRRPEPRYARPPGSPFTYPAFEPSDRQLRNMERLSELLAARHAASPPGYALELAELYREQGRFEEAASLMASIDGNGDDVKRKLIADMISEEEAAPMRYRL
jgi:hypothetical protein